MVEFLNAGSWEVKFIESTAELLVRGYTVERLVQLVADVAEAEQVFSDEAEAS